MRRAFALVVLGVVVLVCTALAASEYLTNRTGKTATAVTVTFSEEVRITSHDELVFPDQEPAGRAETFTFSGGELANGGRFKLSWTPSSAEVTVCDWTTSSPASASDKQPVVPLPTSMVCGLQIGGNWGLNTITAPRPPVEWFEYNVGMNANWIGLQISLGLDDSMDSTVEPRHGTIPGMIVAFDDDVLRSLIRQLRSWGFHVYVVLAFENLADNIGPQTPPGKNLLRFTLGDPRVPVRYGTLPEYWPWSPTHPDHARFVEEFFRTYTDVAVYYGKLLQEEGVELYALGSETEYLFRTRPEPPLLPVAYNSELKGMVEAVRAVYHGSLTYDMNWYSIVGPEDTKQVDKVWGDLGLDVIGVSAYFPISENDLRAGWERIFSKYLQPLNAAYPNKPIVFTEFGYLDTPDARHWMYTPFETFDPAWVDKDGDHLDDGQEEQAAILAALFETTAAHPGVVRGLFDWEMAVGSDADWASPNGYAGERTWAVRGKLAEDVVRNWFGTWLAGDVSRPAAPAALTDTVPDVAASEIDWDSIPVCVGYPYSPGWVAFYCDGDQNLAHARFWGQDGLHVKAFRVGVSDAGLAVSAELYENDRMGWYGYIMSFGMSDSVSFHIFLYPRGPQARLAARVNGQWLELGTTSLQSIAVTDSTIRAWFPSDMYSERFTAETLLATPVDLSLDHIEQHPVFRRELFGFPGSGEAAWVGGKRAVATQSLAVSSLLDFDWEQLPPVLSYSNTPDVEYTFASEYASQFGPGGAAQYWGQPGCKVKAVRAALYRDAVIVHVELYEPDTLGHYRYIVAFRSSIGDFYVFMDPVTSSAGLWLDAHGVWAFIAYVTDEGFVAGDSTVSVVIRDELFSAYVAPATLLQSSVDLHIDYVTAERRELFNFPGQAFSPTDRSGQDFLVP